MIKSTIAHQFLLVFGTASPDLHYTQDEQCRTGKIHERHHPRRNKVRNVPSH